jgi:putative ABC transport system ATP-binding protein
VPHRGTTTKHAVNAIDARDLRKTYRGEGADVEALRGVSLTVASGDFVALTGPSGCGKSTLLNILACVDRPTSGTLAIDGVDVLTLDDDRVTVLRRERIGYVFQFFNLLPTLTVAENIALPLVLAGVKRRVASAAVEDALARVGLRGFESRTPGSLSGGEQQRAAIARAVVHRPALVLADEPTGNLDTTTGAQILALLRELGDTLGTAILMATHAPDAAATADRAIRMRDGALVG